MPDSVKSMTSNEDRALLILDVDETMIHASTERLAREPDFRVGDYYVYRRPFLSGFLARCIEVYRLAVWSSASGNYVAAILARIIPKEINLEFSWARDRCTRRFDQELQEEFYLKNLKKTESLGFSLSRTLIVEDEPRKVQNHYGNAIYVSSFLGSETDKDLEILGRYLPTISSAANVRSIEKRNWRNQVG
jgi:RNA polymerase II subunit A small phosphatase-like protein